MRVSEEDARWLLGQLRLTRELTEAANSVSQKISEGISDGVEIKTTLPERRELIDALERGAAKPRSGELRRLEIELRTTVYAETYFEEQ